MKKRSRRNKRTRGSALLVSLMVIVGLSLLGLGFVAISETENTISKNQETALQTESVAEAGAKMVIEWFQDPSWGLTHGMPSNDPSANPNLNAIKTTRTITGYSGVYKPSSSTKLFDKPYQGANDNRFYGDENHADITINLTTDRTTITNFNNLLLGTNSTDWIGGVVTEIKVYAPPIVGGVLQPASGGFWSGGTRYGVATIKVTAQQFADPQGCIQNTSPCRSLATHAVRIVLGEIPLPVPAGPVQGNANVSFGGSFTVHWGIETSTLSMTPFQPSHAPSTLPWANAYERPHYEHGYEPGSTISSIGVLQGGSGYPSGTFTNGSGGWNVTIAAPCGGPAPMTTATIGTITVNSSGSITGMTLNNNGHGYMLSPPAPTTPGGGCANGSTSWGPILSITAPTGSGASAVAYIAAEAWPITGAQFDTDDDFHELLGKSFDDPWFGARSVGTNTYCPNGVVYQCFGYSFTSNEQSTSQGSYAFQSQSANVWAMQRQVTFPQIRYNFWKRIAQSGRGYQGLFYFTYDSASGGFKKFGVGAAQPMVYWVNTAPTGNGAKLGPGVYFFDTQNGQNPQTVFGGSGAGVLTPGESWNSSGFNPAFQMVGFIYMNAQSFGTTGQGSSGMTTQANFPGEPFRDVGYPVWCTGVDTPLLPVAGVQQCPAGNAWSTCNGSPCLSGAGDGAFSYEDLNGNQQFDVVLMQQQLSPYYSYDPTAMTHTGTTWVVKTWKSPAEATRDYGQPCTVPPANAAPGTLDGTNSSICSEPHEPYLNVIYPTSATSQCAIGWENPATQTTAAKTVDTSGNLIPCPNPPTSELCTSNAFDADGALVPLDVILNGILYNEGTYSAQGNANYYGSLLIQQNVSGTGTGDVWFDERLIKGTWAPPKMPRVMAYSEQTDEMSQQ